MMADLPPSRVVCSRAFLRTGVDLAGPFPIKFSQRRNASTTKGYMVLFVCMSTKATHLEAVSDLTTSAFLACLNRFVARRGLPAEMFSDCGKNLIGAANKLKEAATFLKENEQEIYSHCCSLGFTWTFNPPGASNFGGLWEAGVKSAKCLLGRMVGDGPLTFEEFSTLPCRIEATLNSRPLCFVSSDPHDHFDYLTPGHFLVGAPLIAPPEPPLDLDQNLKTRWSRINQLCQFFWKRWSKEYLHTQIQRHK
ncbi:uncharacterized protein LOC112128021 [Cimex lectularius]|uniref:DUF5641 domain-containing protein n=1 Tax=Cimex lectularius TaxID=79782 RepID=A0A8I6ST19_CIMLE|nr:uncharacterized protein LOC112128021 [Cimex lectularius]